MSHRRILWANADVHVPAISGVPFTHSVWSQTECGIQGRQTGATLVESPDAECASHSGVFAITVPDSASNPVSMLEVFYPARTCLEFFIRNMEHFRGFFGLLAYQGIAEYCIVLLHLYQPFLELLLDLGKFGRPMISSFFMTDLHSG